MTRDFISTVSWTGGLLNIHPVNTRRERDTEREKERGKEKETERERKREK